LDSHDTKRRRRRKKNGKKDCETQSPKKKIINVEILYLSGSECPKVGHTSTRYIQEKEKGKGKGQGNFEGEAPTA